MSTKLILLKSLAFIFLGCQIATAQELIPFKQGDLYGFKDKNTGLEVLKPIYNQVAPFTEDLAFAQRQDKKFFIDKTGKIKVNLQAYDSAYSFSEGYAVVK